MPTLPTASAILLLLLAVPVSGQQAPAAPVPEPQLVAIELVGAKRMTREDAARLSGLTPGKPVRLDALQEAAQRLASSGFFEKVEYRYATKGGRLTVTFELVEAERSVPVVFDNFVWFSDAQLTDAVREELPSFDGSVPQNEDIPSHISRALQKLLEGRKIPGSVSFMPQTDLVRKSLQFIFKVEHPSPRICAVAFEGVSPGPLRELTSDVASLAGRDYSRFYVSSFVAATLIDTYRRLGHWRAAFSPPATRVDAPGCDGVSVTLTADEGPVYAWQAADWKGNAALGADVLDDRLGMKPGELANVVKIKAGLRQVAKAYGSQGYVQVQTSLEPRLDPAHTRAVFEIKVVEGRQFRMGTLEVLGASERDAETLSKRWRLKPGDIFDASYANEFSGKELLPFRRLGRPAPSVQFQVDTAAGVVNVRIVLQD